MQWKFVDQVDASGRTRDSHVHPLATPFSFSQQNAVMMPILSADYMTVAFEKQLITLSLLFSNVWGMCVEKTWVVCPPACPLLRLLVPCCGCVAHLVGCSGLPNMTGNATKSPSKPLGLEDCEGTALVNQMIGTVN